MSCELSLSVEVLQSSSMYTVASMHGHFQISLAGLFGAEMLFCETVKGEYETHLGCLDFQQSIDMCMYSVCLMDTSMHTVRLQDHVVVSLYIMCAKY